MKREFWENVEVGGAKLPKETIDLIMAENGKDIEETKKKFADYEEVKNQLIEANKAVQSYKDMDIDGIRRLAETWEKKAIEAQQDAEKRISEMQFDSMVGTAIDQSKARNRDIVRKSLDLDMLRTSKKQEEDLKNALEKLRETDGYLFAQEEQAAPAVILPTGGVPLDKASEEQARAIMGLPPQK